MRAIAVCAVIFFHAEVPGFLGGFIGVDIFFVISGYLITKILVREINCGYFSFFDFYERRVRRIIPAQFVVILCCIPFSLVLMSPDQLKDFAQSVFSAVLFISNILFWHESAHELGYFVDVAIPKPLLHMWSLSLEEQFYVFFPILLFLIWPIGIRYTLIVFFIILLLSLLFSFWASTHAATFNFYLLPSRCWEFLMGSLVAIYTVKKNVSPCNFCADFGLLLIIAPIFIFNSRTPSPSLYTLIPVVGVTLVILFTGKESSAYKILSNKFFVGLGLISYSTYLWHQPLFSFGKIFFENQLSSEKTLILIVLSLGLGTVTWKLIEQPIRNRTLVSRRQVLVGSIIFAAFLLCFGLLGHTTNGLQQRVDGYEELISVPTVETSFCHREGKKSLSQMANGDFCSIGNGPLKAIIIGDSHAGALFTAADKMLSAAGISAIASSGGFCAPLLNGFDTGADCRRRTEIALNHVMSTSEIETIVLAAEWAVYTSGFRGDLDPDTWRDAEGVAERAVDNAEVFRRSLDVTLRQLESTGKKLVIIGPVPEFEPLGKYKEWLAKQVLRSEAEHISEAILLLPTLPLNEYHKRNADVIEAFNDYRDIASFVDVLDLFCDKTGCYPRDASGDLLYSDFNHVNETGADLIVRKFLPILLDEKIGNLK